MAYGSTEKPDWTIPALNRFLAKISVSEDGCWPWAGGHGTQGYGTIKVDGVMQRAHRFSYEWFIGCVPDGLELDHICRVRHCVNPDHLEPVTHLENMRRGFWATLTHCKRGHEFTPENTGKNVDGNRLCLACKKAYMARYHKLHPHRKRSANPNEVRSASPR